MNAPGNCGQGVESFAGRAEGLRIAQRIKAAGGTVNDAFVTAILGGLRRYHERHDIEMGDIPISMPVSVRREDDAMGGNRFTGAFFSAPSAIATPGTTRA